MTQFVLWWGAWDAMTPNEERQLATKLSRDALHLHERSRRASWFGASIWLRFRALMCEETAARLRRRAG